MERVEIGQSEITSLNFDRYAIPGIQDVPEFDIEIISPRHVPPAGAGETALIVGPPAIANALREATGRRYTALPIRSAHSTA
jgi:CO/xanthine dehydrogenase Mo-binding subunit